MKMMKEQILKWNNFIFNNIFKEKLYIEEKLKNLNLKEINKHMNNE